MSKKVFELNGQKWVSDSEDPAALADIEKHFRELREIHGERIQLVAAARPALDRLSRGVLSDRSGQSYKVRNILFGLWNGKPCSIIQLLNLDWSIRKDLCLVLLAFGFDSQASGEFFYKAIQDSISAAGQWAWFIEESANVETLREYVQAADRTPPPLARL